MTADCRFRNADSGMRNIIQKRFANTLTGHLFTILVTVSLAMLCSKVWAESALDDLGIGLHGFVDVRGGVRMQDDSNEKDTSLGEARCQLDLERMADFSTIRIRADFLYDDVPENDDLDLEDGTGAIVLREASISVSPLNFLDIKLGRQILTWGTGDLLFINDMFPKDWQSFFCGRDVEYLKAPSDALFVSLFPTVGNTLIANVDIAYMP
ncbi:unnamed protein product, partial [marine sediment metagenome]